MNDTLGYLGPRGTFSEEAALLYNRERGYTLRACASISSVFELVSSGKLTEGIIPLENSLEGGVGATMDLLAGREGVLIRREMIHPVTHCLLTVSAAGHGKIKRVYSHPHALGQCRDFLCMELPQAQLCPVESTAAAAKLVTERPDNAAIASRRAAELFKLHLHTENIQDNEENSTRFVIVACRDHPPTGKDKTSLVLSITDGPGSLYHVLGYFARSGVNLTRIESRPARRSPGDWFFFIDCEGHRDDPHLARLWNELSGAVPFLKLLGSYPREQVAGHRTQDLE